VDRGQQWLSQKIIAINEGKLRDFILNKSEYKWLGRQVHHYLSYDGFVPDDSLIFVNLNSRSVVDTGTLGTSVLDKLLDRLLDVGDETGFWKPCSAANCAFADRCYVKYNVDSLRDSKKGPVIRQRLKRLLLAIHFRKTRHITMRDLRSILSFILFSKSTCAQLQADLDGANSVLDRFYYNAMRASVCSAVTSFTSLQAIAISFSVSSKLNIGAAPAVLVKTQSLKTQSLAKTKTRKRYFKPASFRVQTKTA